MVSTVREVLVERTQPGGQRKQTQQENSILQAGVVSPQFVEQRQVSLASQQLGIPRGKVKAAAQRHAAAVADPAASLAAPYRRVRNRNHFPLEHRQLVRAYWDDNTVMSSCMRDTILCWFEQPDGTRM